MFLEPAAIRGSATGGTSTFDFNVHLWRPQPRSVQTLSIVQFKTAGTISACLSVFY